MITFGGLTVPSEQYQGSLGGCAKNAFVSDNKIDLCIKEDATHEVCYSFDLAAGKPQMMIVAGESQIEQRQVYIGGKGFVKGVKREKE